MKTLTQIMPIFFTLLLAVPIIGIQFYFLIKYLVLGGHPIIGCFTVVAYVLIIYVSIKHKWQK